MQDVRSPLLIAMDLEGCLIPEIWIAFARKTGLDAFLKTTRDIKDYDELMGHRIQALADNNLKLKDIRDVIETMGPLPGASDFVEWCRSRSPFIILSDTFYEFAGAIMHKLNHPTLFCHQLQVDGEGNVTGYRLRCADSKAKAVDGFHAAGFRVLAIGDSYNDITMLKRADQGILFHAPQNVCADFPGFPARDEYAELQTDISTALAQG